MRHTLGQTQKTLKAGRQGRTSGAVAVNKYIIAVRRGFVSAFYCGALTVRALSPIVVDCNLSGEPVTVS